MSGHEEPVTASWSQGVEVPASHVPACSLAGPKGRLPRALTGPLAPLPTRMVMTCLVRRRRRCCHRRRHCCPLSLSYACYVDCLDYKISGTHRLIVIDVVVSSLSLGFGVPWMWEHKGSTARARGPARLRPDGSGRLGVGAGAKADCVSRFCSIDHGRSEERRDR